MDTQQYPNSFVANSQRSCLQEHDRHVLTQFLSIGAVLPEQFQEVPVGPHRQGPEARLLHAVLEDALWCFQQQFLPGYGNERRLAREAECGFSAIPPTGLFRLSASVTCSAWSQSTCVEGCGSGTNSILSFFREASGVRPHPSDHWCGVLPRMNVPHRLA